MSFNAPLPSLLASPGKPKPSHTGESSSGQVTKRLRKELMTLMMTPTPGVSAFPESDSNLFRWLGTLAGPDGTVYAGLTYRLSLHFPADYPYKPPVITFETPCYHPNVAIATGDICLDSPLSSNGIGTEADPLLAVLQDKWSAVYSVHTILVSLQSLLGDPNISSPLNVEASQLWEGQEEFKKKVMTHYKPL